MHLGALVQCANTHCYEIEGAFWFHYGQWWVSRYITTINCPRIKMQEHLVEIGLA